MRWPLLLLAFTLPNGPLATASEPNAIQRTTQMLTRALSYDRRLRARSGDDVSIAILFDPNHVDDARAAIGMLHELSGTRIQGLAVRPIALQWTNVSELNLRLVDKHVDILMLCGDELLPHVEAITESTRSHDILTMAPSAQMVRAGASLGAQSEGVHVQLYINLPASRAEGAVFGTELLQLAQVYR